MRAAASRWLVLTALLGCREREGAAPAPPPWQLVHRGPEAIVYLDTVRIRASSAIAEVTLRVDYDVPDVVPWDSALSFQRVDARTQLACSRRQGREVGIELKDSAGAVVETIADTTQWRRFEDHPYGRYVFEKTCDRVQPRLTHQNIRD